MIKLRQVSYKFFIFFSIALILLSPTQIFALSEEKLDFFSQNNILFYDPEAVDDCYDMGAGNTNFEKIVKYYAGNNKYNIKVKAEGIAGIIANFQYESGLSAFRDQVNGPGYGVAQFDPREKILEPLKTDSRTSGYFNEYYNRKYGAAVQNETGIPEGIPPEVNNAWLNVQLDFITNGEFKTTKVGSYRNVGGVMGLDYIPDSASIMKALELTKSASDAARIFVWIYERPRDKIGGAATRSEQAEKILPKVKSIMGGSGGSSSQASDGSNVTVIGDSITVGAKDQILAKLPKADIHAQVSKQFGQGSSNNPGGKVILDQLIKANQLRDIVVFALGTNSSGLTKAEVEEVYKSIGENRHLILLTNYTTHNDYLGNNNIFTDLKNNHKNVYVSDWAAAIKGKTSKYLSSDGIHPNAEGQKLFAELIADGVKNQGGSISSCGGSVQGGLSKKQIEKLADYYKSNKVSGANLPNGKWNCVSLSLWFLRTFTSIKNPSIGNGIDVVHDLKVNNNIKTGTEPRPFAIFSTDYRALYPQFGHTGVVLSVQGDKVYTLEASFSYDHHMDGILTFGEYKLKDLTNHKHPNEIYAYTDGFFLPSELSKIVGEK